MKEKKDLASVNRGILLFSDAKKVGKNALSQLQLTENLSFLTD